MLLLLITLILPLVGIVTWGAITKWKFVPSSKCQPKCVDSKTNLKKCANQKDGCGGECTDCDTGYSCNKDSGLCEVCQPKCSNGEKNDPCGGDNGCGGTCGCKSDYKCKINESGEKTCQKKCTSTCPDGKVDDECGQSDSCGDTCGCKSGLECRDDGSGKTTCQEKCKSTCPGGKVDDECGQEDNCNKGQKCGCAPDHYCDKT